MVLRQTTHIEFTNLELNEALQVAAKNKIIAIYGQDIAEGKQIDFIATTDNNGKAYLSIKLEKEY